MLDEPHQKLHLAANNMTKLDVYGALDASDGYDGFEKTGGGERQGGETQINFLKTSQYGIPASDGNGYSYCSPIKWKRFRIKNVTKEQ